MGMRPINLNVAIDTMLNFDVDVDGQANAQCEHGIRLHERIHSRLTDRQTDRNTQPTAVELSSSLS